MQERRLFALAHDAHQRRRRIKHVDAQPLIVDDRVQGDGLTGFFHEIEHDRPGDVANANRAAHHAAQTRQLERQAITAVFEANQITEVVEAVHQPVGCRLGKPDALPDLLQCEHRVLGIRLYQKSRGARSTAQIIRNLLLKINSNFTHRACNTLLPPGLAIRQTRHRHYPR